MKRRDKINYYLDIAETVLESIFSQKKLGYDTLKMTKLFQPDITVLPEEESTVPIRETVSAIP